MTCPRHISAWSVGTPARLISERAVRRRSCKVQFGSGFASGSNLRKHDPEAKPLPNWTLHDLRRTARSLMSRAGVPTDHAEMCLGHVITGVRGTYDRYEYHAEKKAAYKA